LANLASHPATAADITAFYGESQRMTIKALVVTLDGEQAGLIGLASQGRCARFFSEFRPELREHLKSMTCLRTIKAAMEFVKASRLPVYALAQCDENEARKILTRLGFVRDEHSPELFLWRN
jgi:hypothetical protein